MDSITKSMTPEELLANDAFAVIRTSASGEYRWMVSHHIMEGSALDEADIIERNNPESVYGVEVVTIDHSGSLSPDLKDANERIEALETALEMICDYIEREARKLRCRHDHDVYVEMNDLDHYRYDLDREAYATLSYVQALISGVTLGEYGGLLEGFPMPDYGD